MLCGGGISDGPIARTMTVFGGPEITNPPINCLKSFPTSARVETLMRWPSANASARIL
jgi:hypothetical protein